MKKSKIIAEVRYFFSKKTRKDISDETVSELIELLENIIK